MLYVIFSLLVWFICGVVATGVAFAYFAGKYPDNRRGNLAFAWCWGLLGGPFSLCMSLPLSGFCKHGWRLR